MSNLDKRRRFYFRPIYPEFIISIDQLSSDPAAITVENENVVTEFLSKFRRCLCKVKGYGEVAICYLDDSNSNYYHDGTSADLTGSDGYVMVYFPEMYYNCIDDGVHLDIHISTGPRIGYHYSASSLVGAYKMDWLCGSVSGSYGTTNLRFDSYSSSLRSKYGYGYHFIDYMQHRIINWMFYARYKTRNSRSVCGVGRNTSNYIANGSTNDLGMTDTTPTTANSRAINFLGIEGCWGHPNEFVEGIHAYYGDKLISVYDKGDYSDKSLYEISSSSLRSFTNDNEYSEGISGYIRTVWGGSYGDMLMKSTSNDASASSYFCDRGSFIPRSQYSNSYDVFIRAGENTGIAEFYQIGRTYYSWNTGARIAWDGMITEIKDVNTFKNLPVL